MNKVYYEKPAMVVIEVNPSHIMSGSPLTTSSESVNDYILQDEQIW